MIFEGTTINESPVIIAKASAEIADPRGLALALTADGLALPTAGKMPIGIALFDSVAPAKQGEDITVQIKDIGKAIAAEAINAGDMLAVDATGKLAKATTGQYVFAVALSTVASANSLVKVQIIKAGTLPTE